MKYFEFNYNKKFSCVANVCKHNCCIGWEIKVDKKSLSLYSNLKTNDNRFNENSFSKNCFSLKNNRCVFLDGDNLCHIIKNYGEKSLCKTCATHPRFKNFFSGITETGLGLYCEEAGRIILSQKEKMKLLLVKDDKKPLNLSKFEKKIFSFRKKVLSVIQNRKKSIKEKLISLSLLADINLDKLSFDTWKNIFNSLEKLKTNEFSFEDIPKSNDFNPLVMGFDREYEQLLSYLTFRHLSRAIDFLDLRVRLSFVLLSFKMINHLFSLTDKSFNSLIEVCRFYSSEIECSDDNIFCLLNEIESLVSFI